MCWIVLTGLGRIQEEAYLGLDPEKPPRPIRTGIYNKTNTSAADMQKKMMRQTEFGISLDLASVTVQADLALTNALFFPYR